jgi:uncharacterized metal-binding protein YceD (DUF177 family)
VSEFSRIVQAAQIERTQLSRHIAADATERAGLAQRFGLVAIDRLEADVTLRRIGPSDIAFEAEIAAEVTQSCVITLEPVQSKLRETFRLIYRPGLDEEEADRLALENPDDDLVEPLGETIDLGEAVAQQLSIALDPFPRAAGAEAALAALGLTGDAQES